MDKILNLRQLIDELDNKIMSLLEERFSLSLEIGKQKTLAKIDALDMKRKNVILDKTSKYNHFQNIGVVYKTIMDESKSLQRK